MRGDGAQTGLLLTGLALVALALRLPMFDDPVWADELSTSFVVHGFGIDSPLGLVASDQEGTPPLFYLLSSLTKGVGDAEGLRIVSLLAGVAAVPLTYLLGVRTVGRAAALVGAALIALGPIQIVYSTEARAYALAMLLGLVAALALLQATESGQRRWWVAFALASAATAYAHYTAVLIPAALVIWAFFAHPEARRSLALSVLGALALFAPWLPELNEDRRELTLSAALILFHPFTFDNVSSDIGGWMVGHPFAPLSESPGRLGACLALVGALLGGIGLLSRARVEGRWRPSAETALVLILAAAAPVGVLLYSLVGETIFTQRNLLASSPGLALTAGALVTAGRGALRVVAVGLLIGGVAIGASMLLDRDNQRPDFDAAATYIEERGPPGAPVVDLPQPTPGPQTAIEAALAETGEPRPDGRQVLTLGYPLLQTRLGAAGSVPPRILDPLPTPTAEQVAQRAAALPGSGTLFLVSRDPGSAEELRADPVSPAAAFLRALPPEFEVVETRTFPGYDRYPLTVHRLERTGSGPP